MQGLLAALLKVLAEVIADVLTKLLSRPDVVAPEVKPEFESLATASPDLASADLLRRFNGLLGADQPGSDLRQGNAAP